MYGLVVGCCAVSAVSRLLVGLSRADSHHPSQAFVPSSPLPLLDPTRAEAKTATAFASLACMPALGTITNVGVSGVVSFEKLDEVSFLLSALRVVE